MNIEVFNETNEDLEGILKELHDYLVQLAKDSEDDNIIYNVVITDNESIRRLNKEYRNIDSVTDVITFALEDDKSYNREDIRILGDIYISLDRAKEQSIEYRHSFKRELFFLATHGFLHLLGYDHMTKEDEVIMFQHQKEVLSRYGIERKEEN